MNAKLLRAWSIEMLAQAEEMYLLAHGWEKAIVAEGHPVLWNAPKGYPFRKKLELHQGHAINTQRNLDKYNRQREMIADLIKEDEEFQTCSSPNSRSDS